MAIVGETVVLTAVVKMIEVEGEENNSFMRNVEPKETVRNVSSGGFKMKDERKGKEVGIMGETVEVTKMKKESGEKIMTV